MVYESDIHPDARFYFLAGSDENEQMIPDQQKMIDLLARKGVAKDHIKNIIIEGGRHNEELWRDNFPEAYQWLIRKN